MCVRYNTPTSGKASYFTIEDKHRTLLRMDDEQHPALHVEVITTECDGYRIIFGDYQIGDAPLLIVNTLLQQSISFSQQDDLYAQLFVDLLTPLRSSRRAQILPAQYYVFYTWMDPFKPRQVTITVGQFTATIELNVNSLFSPIEMRERANVVCSLCVEVLERKAKSRFTMQHSMMVLKPC